MATDLYLDGKKWRVRHNANTAQIIERLKNDFGAVDTIFGFEVVDENGNEGVLRLDPSRLASIAIIAVPD